MLSAIIILWILLKLGAPAWRYVLLAVAVMGKIIGTIYKVTKGLE